MDKSKLIVSDKYQTTHGCKVFTSNDDSNISMDEICEVMDISKEEIICMMFNTMDKSCMKEKQWEMVRGTNLKLYLILH